MPTALLTSKLHIPPPRPEMVQRPRLMERLATGLPGGARKLTVISAPPGFGKTTLLSEWAQAMGAHRDAPLPQPGRVGVAWLTLDQGDNDPARFLAYLVAALQTLEIGPGATGPIGEDVLGALQMPQPLPLDALLTVLANDLATVPTPFLLILDDYHLIEAPQIHRAVSFLLEHMPPQMHLVISTRADPPLALSRLRGRDAITEIRTDDLRFTPGEAAAFLRQVMGLELSSEDVAMLETRTEGWIAGLQLAALALQGLAQKGRGEVWGGEASDFVAAFAGDDRYIADYLVEEVLQHQPDPVQSFLLQTAILDRLSGPLCDAVLRGDSGQPSMGRGLSVPDHPPPATNYAQSMLEMLERGNLFLLPLDQKRQWYRYHRLFADLLRRHLQQMPTLAAQVSELHLRASAWFEQNGYTAEAIGHALAAQDFERAAHLLEVATWTIISQGEITTLRGWLEALPEALIRSRPRLGLIHAWTLMAAMDLEAVEPCLREVEQRLATAGDATAGGPDPEGLLGEVVAIRASVASLRGDVTTTLELSREALARLPEENLRLRGLLANTLGSGYDSLGEVGQASEAFAQSAALSQAVGNTLIALIALGNLARVQEIGGQLRQAAATCRRALRLGAEQGRMPPAAGVAYVGLGRLLYEWDDLDAAMEHITKGIDMGRRAGIAELVAAGCAALARVHQAQGQQAAALGAIGEA
jgi:LuxR family maltose regulon positive regulatory protein